MKVFNQLQGKLHRRGARIGQFRPMPSDRRPDGGLRLGQRQPQADEAVHVAVGDVVDGLPDGPASGAVRRIELGIVQAANGVAVERRGGGDLRDQPGVLAGITVCWKSNLPIG